MKKSVNLPHTDTRGMALSIFVDATNEPYGILLPLTDWPKLKASLHQQSPLYKLMVKLTFKSFHQQSLQEKSTALDPVIIEAEKANLEKGSYITYTNELCTSKDLFINEYTDRKELVSVDAKTGKIKVIKQLD